MSDAEDKEMSDEEKEEKRKDEEEKAMNFSKSLDDLGEGGLWTDEYLKSLSYTERCTWTDEEKKENLQKLEDELLEFFYSVLEEYYKKRSETTLKKSSSSIDKDLDEDFKDLWFGNVKYYGWGFVGPERNWLPSTPSKSRIKKNKIMGDLFRHGKYCERFWLKDKNFEVLIETFENCVEQKLKKDIDNMLGMIFGVGDKKKLSEGEVQVMFDKVKKGTQDFIEDLKENRGELKENLFGLENRLKHFASVWLPYLTFAAVIVFGAVGLSKEGQWTEAVMIVLGFVGITLLGFYKMNK